GYTCVRLARERPDAPIMALTPNEKTARKLTMSWGAHPIQIAAAETLDEVAEKACDTAVRDGFAKPGDALVIAAGMPFGQADTTNLIRIANIWASTYEKHGHG
ncbi:MAG: pyruvate kinase alpha/beta domain-containing protein, partial [Pseudomonadales bacterium]